MIGMNNISNYVLGGGMPPLQPETQERAAPSVAPTTAARQESVEAAFPSNGKPILSLVPKKPIKFAHIGVVGGMGPVAGNDFCNLLVKEAFSRLDQGSRVDQNAPPYTLDSQSPNIGDRTAYLLKHDIAALPPEEKAKVLAQQVEGNPLPGMVDSIERLRNSGAKLYVVTCNTAHAWSGHFPKGEGLAHVHIVEAALNAALEKPAIKAKLAGGEKVKVGLLATTGTVQNKIYQDYLKKMATKDLRFKNVEFVTPDDDVQKNLVMEGIYGKAGVKANNLEQGGKLLRKAGQHLIDKGVDALSLSCTEIPLVVKQEHFPDTAVIDANAALAKAAIDVSIRIANSEEPIKAKL